MAVESPGQAPAEPLKPGDWPPDRVWVAATNRLARWAVLAYGRRMQEVGHQCWPAPEALSFEAWLRQEFSRLRQDSADFAGTVLLDDAQERLLWQKAAASGRVSRWRPSNGRTLAAAWRLQCEWRLSFSAAEADNAIQRNYCRWRDDFIAECRARSLLTRAELAGVLAKAWAEGVIEPRPMLFVELHWDTPARRQLRASLEQIGFATDPGRRQDGARRDGASLIRAGDGEDEVERIAWWARTEHEKNPAAALAVIDANLGERGRAQLYERVLERVFASDAPVPGTAASQRPFNIAGGGPLGRCPAIEAALSLLRLAVDGLEGSELTQLLLSPHWGRSGRILCGSFDARLRGRDRRRRNFLLAEVAEEARRWSLKRQADYGFVALAKNLKKLDGVAEKIPDSSDFKGWAHFFGQCLQAAGWPAAGSDSAEYQQIEAWRGEFDRFAGLDLCDTRPLFGSEALAWLQELMEARIFQPESPWLPVQILQPANGAGIQFDSAWVASATADNWPRRSQPHPLIPAQLQREAGVPGTDPQRALAEGREQLVDLHLLAPQLRFSYAGEKEGVIQSPTPLLAGLEVEDAPDWEPFDYRRQLWRLAPVLEVQPGAGVPLPSGGDRGEGSVAAPVKGGTALLSDQCDCPFRAFARHRLGSRAPEDASVGFDARQLGDHAHRALKLLWEDLQNSEALGKLSDTELQERVAGCVDRTLADNRASGYLQVERGRLNRLVLEWLEVERMRPPFTVTQVEARQDFELGPLRLRGTIDRLDRLEDDSCAVIDYKSGEIGDNSWDKDRLKNPQLPLYATQLKAEYLAFAVLRSGEAAFKGRGRGEALAPGVSIPKEGWKQWFGGLERKLLSLADEIAAGEARVDPIDGSACQYCEQRLLCRIDDREAEEAD